jgi:hypothetical protein
MKKKNLIWLVSLAIGFVFVACNVSDDNANVDISASSADQVALIAQNGDWRITTYTDDGVDETSDFNGFTFTFGSDGILIAMSSSRTLAGTWSVTDSNNSTDDDDGTDDDDFNIFFSVSEDDDFDDLVDDWDITLVNATTISLFDVSGGNGGTDVLIFTKN